MTTNFGRAGRAVSVVVVLGLAGGLSACAGGGAKGPAGDPLEVVRSHQANPAARAEAIGQAVRNAEKDPSSGVALHNALMTVAWDPAEAPPLRAVAIRTLLAQPEGASLTEAKAQAMVVLPRESSREVVQTICRAAGARGWKDFTPSIVRSYARVVPLVPNEEDRSEREALVALYPGRAVDEVVFDVFASPPPAPPDQRPDWADRVRADAWDVLGRLDPTGARQRQLVRKCVLDDPVIAALHITEADLRAVPRSGDELLWAKSLRSKGRPELAAWWDAATGAIAKLPNEIDLCVRHAEPVRWAAIHHPEWLKNDRAGLAAMVEKRLEGREHFERSGDPSNMRPRESWSVVGPKLEWGDLLSILVLDEALRAPGIATVLVEQAKLDRKDTTTEYGGAIDLRLPVGPRMMLFPPRPGERQGDNMFIASPDMIQRSDMAAAHYHFHAQTVRNAEVAGPSSGDLAYAKRFGRNCILLTTLKEGVLGVDYYQPDGLVLDLGTLTAK